MPSSSTPPALFVVRKATRPGTCSNAASTIRPQGVRSSYGYAPSMTTAPVSTLSAAKSRAGDRLSRAPRPASTSPPKLAMTTSGTVTYEVYSGWKAPWAPRPYMVHMPSPRSTSANEFEELIACSDSVVEVMAVPTRSESRLGTSQYSDIAAYSTPVRSTVPTTARHGTWSTSRACATRGSSTTSWMSGTTPTLMPLMAVSTRAATTLGRHPGARKPRRHHSTSHGRR